MDEPGKNGRGQDPCADGTGRMQPTSPRHGTAPSIHTPLSHGRPQARRCSGAPVCRPDGGKTQGNGPCLRARTVLCVSHGSLRLALASEDMAQSFQSPVL